MGGNLITKELAAMTGKVPFRLTNDYLFRMVFQESEEALRGLLCSLLKMDPSKIHSIQIENPVIPGSEIKLENLSKK